MKSNVLLILILMFVSAFVFSQQNNKSNNPKEDIKVNKHYDENGNLIGYDSTYVSTWSSDTTITEFPGRFNFQEFFGKGDGFFDHDSLFSSDPFQNFGFHNNMTDVFSEFERMFSDTTNMDYFSFQNDSSLLFDNDSIYQFGFRFGDNFFDDSYKDQLNDTTKNNKFPQFKHPFFFENDSIFRRQEKMMKEYMKEVEKLQRQFFNME